MNQKDEIMGKSVHVSCGLHSSSEVRKIFDKMHLKLQEIVLLSFQSFWPFVG